MPTSPRLPGLLRACAAAVLALLFAAGPASAKPALWMVQSATTTIYLFGTIHALPPDTNWHSPKLDHAFAQAKELWLEIDDGGSYRASAPLVERLAADFTHPLSSKLTATQINEVDAALKKLGKWDGVYDMQFMRPWYVAMLVGGVKGMDWNRGNGVDLTLQEDAAEADKPVHALETKEQQLRIFADLPPKQELAFFDEALHPQGDPRARLNALLDAWMAGDVDKIATYAGNHDGAISAEMYRRLLVERNKNWAVKISEMLKDPGIIMIAGGAAHFAGPDSVIADLARMGIDAQRVQ